MNKKIWLKNYEKGIKHTFEVPTITLPDLLERAAKEHKDSLAIRYEGNSMTYGELYHTASNIAGNLRLHGLDRGDKVCVFLPNLPETVLSFWGVQQAGLVGVMTNPLYSPDEILHQIKNSESKAVITTNALLPKVLQIIEQTDVESVFCVTVEADRPVDYTQEGIYPWERLLTENIGYKCKKTKPSDLALLQYTGGTTGVSKGCMLSQSNLISNAMMFREFFCSVLTEGKEKFVAVLPYFHIYGLQVNIVLTALVASATYPVMRFTPISLLELIQEEKLTVLASAPSIFNACLSRPELKNYDLSSLKIVLSGSAPLAVAQKQLFEDMTGAKVCEGYGLSETSPVTHFTPVVGENKPGSIGMPMPSTNAKIVDLEYGVKELPQGEEGELCIQGPQVMSGYYKSPAETADVLDEEGWLKTGDIARMDEDGYFYITGRKKELIITGGYNVYPREIEEVLFKHEAIKEVVAKGIPDELRGEAVKAYVVLNEGATLTKNEVVAYCRKHLANYKVPREVEFMKELPKSAVGKILRRALN